MIVEICANSYESAIAADKGGAHRIELCVDLSLGGLTPPLELIDRVIEKISIPVHVLIRPRPGDFFYSDEELGFMLNTIEQCKSLGSQGIVSGALTPSKQIDLQKTQKLIEASAPMKFIFHRAIDLVIDPIDAIENLKNYTIEGILSSGQERRVIEGLPMLKKMLKATEGAFEIIPGGGVNPTDIQTLIDSGFNAVHLSAIRKKSKRSSQGSIFSVNYEGSSDPGLIREVVARSAGKL
jgi:copper homeostasis protein